MELSLELEQLAVVPLDFGLVVRLGSLLGGDVGLNNVFFFPMF